jgi:putative membrane protein
MGFLLRVIVNAVTIALAAHFVPGIFLNGAVPALVAGLVLGIINAVVRPIFVVLTIPLTNLTLGLFLFVLNAFCLWLTSVFVPGFTITGFGPAFLGALIISLVSWLLSRFVGDRRSGVRVRELRP